MNKTILKEAQRRRELFRKSYKHSFDLEKEFGKAKKLPIEGLRLREGFEYI